jgi:hypothetical protein
MGDYSNKIIFKGDREMSGYIVLKPRTPYQTEEDCPMKFANGEEFTMDEAIKYIADSGKPFKMTNVDLLHYALKNTPPQKAS